MAASLPFKTHTPPALSSSPGGRPVRPRIDVAFPVLPPALDGIGDHTARLARALASHADVRILSGPGTHAPIPGVPVEPVFGVEMAHALPRPRDMRRLAEAARQRAPDWLLLQYNPFSYGRRGFNPFLPLALHRLAPATRLAVMFHERFVPVNSWKFALMALWQRPQFYALARQADAAFFSIEAWTQHLRRHLPEKTVAHLPVGSNIPHAGVTRAAARRQLGLGEGTFALGLFGSAHASRLLSYVRAAADALRRDGARVRVVYVGKDGARVRRALGATPLLDAGTLGAEDVSRHFSAMDLYLSPFVDGVSTRRGSFMTGLQHGCATIATRGHHTDALLEAEDGRAFLLAPVGDPDAFAAQALALYRDPTRRRALGAAAQHFYDRAFDWPVLATSLLNVLSASTTDAPAP